eukprot:TRINITY_DN10333_c0_g1_i11.p1 TRINITY_DN10333_c0_g1~~TRINITY_DN10333_c0_g1_i11.p1  ORF type:complete len:148 (+),score=53.43 TRINITY_DN10333_c0_g1_i11:127-570(+)
MVEQRDSFMIRRMLPKEAYNLRVSLNSLANPLRSYKITNNEQRYQLVYKVLQENMSVAEAAAVYGIKYTTAKNVLNLYLREGRIEKKKHRARKPPFKAPNMKVKTSVEDNLKVEENSYGQREVSKEGTKSVIRKEKELPEEKAEWQG